MSRDLHVVEERTRDGWEAVVAFTERAAKAGGYVSAWAGANRTAESLLRHGVEHVRTVKLVRGYHDFERETGRWSQHEVRLLDHVINLIAFYRDYLTVEDPELEEAAARLVRAARERSEAA